MEKDVLGQLMIYSILSSTAQNKKINQLLSDALNIKLRKELENKISELEEHSKELQSKVDSMIKIKSSQDEELQTLKERRKYLEKENKRLVQDNEELKTENNLLRAKIVD
jgi:peptidoglycan hydrolase CwlO-like protein